MNRLILVGKRVSWQVKGRRSLDYTSGVILAYVPPGVDVFTLIPEGLSIGSSQKCFRKAVSNKERYLIVVTKTSDRAMHGEVKKHYYAPLTSQIEQAYWGAGMIG